LRTAAGKGLGDLKTVVSNEVGRQWCSRRLPKLLPLGYHCDAQTCSKTKGCVSPN